MRLGLALFAGACAHSEPTGPADVPVADGPLSTAAPTRLTFDPGMDQLSGLSPDGATLLYSFQPLGRADRDRCLAFLPAAGGTREEYCENATTHQDLTDALEMPALGADGALLYAAYQSPIGAALPTSGELRLATRTAPGTARTLLAMPTNVGGFGFDRIGTIRWVSPSVVYLVVGSTQLTGSPISLTDRDTLFAGVGILRGEIGATSATFTAVPGTATATDFDFSPQGDSLYVTLRDDPSLYAMAIAGGARRTVFTEPRIADSAAVLTHPVRIAAGIVVVREMYQDPGTLTPPKGSAPIPPVLGLMPRSALRLLRTDGSTSLLAAAPSARPAPGSGALAAFGRIAAWGDRLVAEHRLPFDLSFITDLYAYCVQGNGC